MNQLENICPYETCTRKTTCRTRDYTNCPIYQEFDFHQELFPKDWDVESIYEAGLHMANKRINKGMLSLRGGRL
jgi:hypothetical protein